MMNTTDETRPDSHCKRMSARPPRIWDISQPLRPGIPVWPGDTEYAELCTWQMGVAGPVNVSRITLSTHTGTHADAPLHYTPHGASAGELDLQRYIGPCRVITVSGTTPGVTPEEVGEQLAPEIERVLLRTYRQAPLDDWDPHFRSLAVETVELLARSGVVLVGVDTPSLDAQDSKTLAAHKAAAHHGLAILESLVLDAVPDGDYELIAVPLRLVNLDAAPVRAVLRELG